MEIEISENKIFLRGDILGRVLSIWEGKYQREWVTVRKGYCS